MCNANELREHHKAIKAFDKAIEINPNYAQAYLNKGHTLSGLGKLEEGILQYDKAIQFNPANTDSYFSKAGALAMLGKYQEAIVIFR